MNEKYVECFMNDELGIEMYVHPHPLGVYFNYNDLCDMLDIPYKRRVNRIKKIDELRKIRIMFRRNDNYNLSEETFINMAEVSKILTEYGKGIDIMMDRKYSVETLVYNILNNFDKNDINKEEGVSNGDKFILDALYCDSVIADKANQNLINLLRNNEFIESVISHKTFLDVNERLNELYDINYFVELSNQLEELNNELYNFTNKIEDVDIEIDFLSIAKSDEGKDYIEFIDYDETNDDVVKRM